MSDYYTLMMDSINYVQDKVQGKHGNPIFFLNKCQCEYVAQELSKVLAALQSKSVETLEHGNQRIVLLHLHGTVKRAQLLVERCCSENSSWLARAMTLGDIKEEVIAILLGLHQWIFVLDIVNSASVGGNDPQGSQLQLLEMGEEGYQRLSKQESKMQNAIRDAARQDQEDLLQKIENLGGKEDQGGDDYIRGVYLKSQLNHIEGDLQSVEELKAYTISRDLGSGASGMVLEVKWLGQDLALKILKVIDRAEATVLGPLHHPNIVRLFHYWEEFSPYPRSCIIMELMPQDLQKHIENVLLVKQSDLPLKSMKGSKDNMPFVLSVAIDIMLQLAEAMRQVHERKLTHRDLKTSNILVRPVSESMMELHSQGYLEVKLADFGSAKAYAKSSISRDLTRNIGTTVYGAPEIFGKEKIERERNFPPKADVWSFGMTCSEILTGDMPFADETSYLTLHRRIRANGLRPSLPKDCPEYLQFCIKSCWELEPQRRPSFLDLCRMLRHAKFVSLGLIDLENNKCFIAYKTYYGVLKGSMVLLHRHEEPKKSLFRFGTIWRNMLGGSSMEQPSKSTVTGVLSGIRDSSRPKNIHPDLKLVGVRAFTKKELAKATDNFSREKEIGQGYSGKVYRGKLQDGMQVAIKVAHLESYRGAREFYTEIELLSRVHHRNLVILEGYCFDRDDQMLVYEFISGGNLQDHLFDVSDQAPLDFPTRLQIALDSARGILYLHTGANPPILHRNIKPCNILLDNHMVAKITDFGLSVLAPVPDMNGVTFDDDNTIICGTLGYIDPVYLRRSKVTDKSDVYSFGVVLLQLITGMRAFSGDGTLVNQVNARAVEGKALSLVDPHIAEYSTEAMECFIKLALRCCRSGGEERPTMAEVVSELEQLIRDRLNNFSMDMSTPTSPPPSSPPSSSPDSGGI